MLRRALLSLALAAGLTLGLGGDALAQASAIRSDDRVLGRADAPVTVIEYASVTCPHCANWHNQVFPAFKARYIDTGRVRFVYREFLTDPGDMSAAGALVARCAPAERYFDVIGSLFRGQAAYYASGSAGPWLIGAGAAGGLSEAQVRACVDDQAQIRALVGRLEAAEAAGILSTPTFVINGRTLEGEQSLAQLAAVIDPLLRGR
ncbi:DsbA family protein [Brevundimonas sp. 2R-24]|uniref:DsbA family protein n=1 Tax=Peiella sedimenti TaxID=3061083 RepID=A0ABT8SMY4_9CAUL|nr:DsbA family protein [Caulobacteraceae bacterium XZ-24]